MRLKDRCTITTNTPNSSASDEIRTSFCVNDDPNAPCVGTFNSYSTGHSLLMTARSYHPGGVQVVLGDGSVHFANQSIALNVWQAVGNPKATNNDVMFLGFE